MYADRIPLYEAIEADRDTKVLAYITGDRKGLETKISSDVLHFVVDHLDSIGVTERISLLLYTRGGDTLAAWGLANLLRLFCDELEVIIPSRAHSAGTLISLAADTIVMTKQAALGPIDPSVTTPLNPSIDGAPATTKAPVNVENVNGFLEFARETLGDDADLGQVFLHLAETIHPMVLGQAYRSRSQIRMLASRLLENHMNDDEAVAKILDFLCSESGSHDYTINRREAKNRLELPIEKPTQQVYLTIKAIADDFAAELELNTPYDANLQLAGNPTVQYSLPRALVESVEGGSDTYLSEGTLTTRTVQTPQGQQQAIQDQRNFEGWRHTDAP